MASQPHHLHFLMIPLMCPGHIIPMMDMAKLLAQRGVTVTIVTTPVNATRFSAAISRAIESGLPVRLLRIRFPSVEAGLPEGCENFDEVPSFDLVKNFTAATVMLQQPLEQMLEKLKPGPSCIISDKSLAWTVDTARKFRIPRLIFDGMSCFTQLITHKLYISKAYENVPDSESFVVPGLPDQIELTKAQLPGAFNPGSKAMDMQDFRERIREAEIDAYGVIINSFEELEQRYVDEFRKIRGDKVWCIGPLSLCNKRSWIRLREETNPQLTNSNA
ncbi:unnamed protein product [Ilex paraguariensis]|uniref:Glycosyltransferase N-terminal domain-containing protein n=1 Tax=Ilex paraguariensis TaxID=185542 RepID=A0ABC8R1H6_9AQUA